MIVTLTRDTQIRLAPGLQLDLTADGLMDVRAVPSRFRRFVVKPFAALVILAAVGGSGYLAAKGLGIYASQAEAAQSAPAAAPPALLVPPPPGAAPQSDAFGPG